MAYKDNTGPLCFSDSKPVSLPQSSVCGLSGQHRTTLLFRLSTGQFTSELSLWPFRTTPNHFAFPTISRSVYLKAQFVAFQDNTGPLCFSDYQPVSLLQSSVCGLSGQHWITLLFRLSAGHFTSELSLWPFWSTPDHFAFPTLNRSVCLRLRAQFGLWPFWSTPDHFAFRTFNRSVCLRAQFVAFEDNTGPLCFSDY